jgi:hypothetical protein
VEVQSKKMEIFDTFVEFTKIKCLLGVQWPNPRQPWIYGCHGCPLEIGLASVEQ